MLVYNASDERHSTEQVRSRGGVVRVLARATRELPGGSLCKVVYHQPGYLAVPITAPAKAYFVGYLPRMIAAGELLMIQIGGGTGPVRLHEGIHEGMWIRSRDGMVAESSGQYQGAEDFAYVESRRADGALHLVLVAELVREQT